MFTTHYSFYTMWRPTSEHFPLERVEPLVGPLNPIRMKFSDPVKYRMVKGYRWIETTYAWFSDAMKDMIFSGSQNAFFGNLKNCSFKEIGHCEFLCKLEQCCLTGVVIDIEHAVNCTINCDFIDIKKAENCIINGSHINIDYAINCEIVGTDIKCTNTRNCLMSIRPDIDEESS